MGINERRIREKEVLRKKILVAAEEILLTKGWEHLSIRKIAAVIEYSPATIYLYFKSKSEIIYELMGVGFNVLIASLQTPLLEEDPLKKIKKLGIAFIEFGTTHTTWFDLMFNPNPLIDFQEFKDDTDPGHMLFNILYETCEVLIQKGYTNVKDATILTTILWSNGHGMVSLIRSKQLEVLIGLDKIDIVNQTIDTFIEGFFSKKNKGNA